jgi:hypothetical protein
MTIGYLPYTANRDAKILVLTMPVNSVHHSGNLFFKIETYSFEHKVWKTPISFLLFTLGLIGY